MSIIRYTVNWTAGAGGPGTSTFHWGYNPGAGLLANVNAIRAFFNSIAAQLPSDVTITFPGEASIINVPDGELLGIEAVAAPASVVGTSSAAYSAPTGARVRWVTAGIRNGRRVTGSTFIVPLQGAGYDTDGSLNPTTVTALNNAATTLRTALDTPYVYGRPTGPGAADGVIHPWTGNSVPDKAAVLRSRRD